jgi:phosphate-selective porin OprO/OprP
VIREPFSIDALSSGINLPFLERALPNAFAAGFNPGVLFENLALDGALHWQAGAFRYVGDDSDQNRTDIAARITGVPWSADEDARLLHVGGGYMLQTGQFELRLRQRPELHLAARWVDTKKFAADRAHVFGLEGAGAFGRMSFQSELMYSSVDAESGSSLAFWGGYAQVSLFLSEDRRPYVRRQGLFGRVHPSRPFDHRQGSWGAWELAARFSYVDLDDGEIRGGTLQDITLGLNWYPTAHLRVAFNYVRAHLNGVGTGNHLGLRCQFAY